MSDLYTDDDVRSADMAVKALHGGVDLHDYSDEMRAILDAVAPAIAARALREAADAYVNVTGGSKARPVARTWLRARADEIYAP